MERAKVFIGSSSEGLPFAEAIRGKLDNDVDITLWNDNFFAPGSSFIESLLRGLPNFDFAILVFTSDDQITSRNEQLQMPRDNVIFELGLFMGHLGRDRAFIVREENANLKVLSDMAGEVIPGFRRRADGNYAAAVGSACNVIRYQMLEKGALDRNKKTSAEISNIKYRQDAMENEVRTLQILTKALVSEFEMEKLEGLAGDVPFMVKFHNDMLSELKHLDAIRFIKPQPGYGLNDIHNRDNSADDFDLKQYVTISKEGRDYLRLRNDLLQQ